MFGNSFYQKIKGSFSEYAVSLIAIVVTSVYGAILFVMEFEFDVAFWGEPVFDAIGRGLVCFCFGTVFAETFFTGQKRFAPCLRQRRLPYRLPSERDLMRKYRLETYRETLCQS